MTASGRIGRRQRPQVEWLHRWSPTAASALERIPEHPACPRELYGALLERRCSADTPVAIVRDDDRPLAVVGLQHRHPQFWEPITEWWLPGFVGQVADVDAVRALDALRRPVRFPWWEMSIELPTNPHVRDVRTTVVHRLAPRDREEYWRTGRQWKNVSNARRRCGHLEVCVNQPGDTDWVLRSSFRKWNDSETVPDHVIDRIALLDELTPLGRHVSIVLRDGDRPLAGCSAVVYRNVSAPGVFFRDESVGNLPTGVRLFDALFDWAESEDLDAVDVGGGFSYKEKWAPPAGFHQQVDLVPTIDRVVRRGRAAWHATVRTSTSAVRRARQRLRPPTEDSRRR